MQTDFSENSENENDRGGAQIVSVSSDSEPVDNTRTFRRWIFTWNNYTDADETSLQAEEKFCYLTYGREVAPTTGTRHLQGYLVLRRAVRFSQLHREFPRLHWEPAICSEAKCKRYAQKCGDFFERDTRVQGRRTDLDGAVETLKEKGLSACRREHPTTYLKYPRGFDALAKEFTDEAPPTIRNVQVAWLYGPTGSGKTHYVYNAIPDVFSCPDIVNLRWFDGYRGQKHVLFDDFRAEPRTFNTVLRLLDKYPIRVEVKGDYVWWRPEFIFITCPRHWRDEFCRGQLSHEDVQQVGRRITVTYEFRVDHSYVEDQSRDVESS